MSKVSVLVLIAILAATIFSSCSFGPSYDKFTGTWRVTGVSPDMVTSMTNGNPSIVTASVSYSSMTMTFNGTNMTASGGPSIFMVMFFVDPTTNIYTNYLTNNMSMDMGVTGVFSLSNTNQIYFKTPPVVNTKITTNTYSNLYVGGTNTYTLVQISTNVQTNDMSGMNTYQFVDNSTLKIFDIATGSTNKSVFTLTKQ